MKCYNLKSILLLISFLISTASLSQVPKGFNYMAIARDESGELIESTPLWIQIAILNDPGTVLWDEQHAVTTNAEGLFQLIVGDPAATPVGGVYDFFADIDWTEQPLFLRTKISLDQVDWKEMGTAQLFSVPYSLVSDYSHGLIGNPVTMDNDTVVLMNSVDVIGNYPVTEEEALFEVKRQDGKTMFAVYNQGVRINIPMDDLKKGPKGGFAIGGFSGTKGTTHNLFVLNKDSARIFLDQTPNLLPKGAKGGFAIGGFAYTGKADVIQNYLYVAPDSARIYVKEQAKGAKGGFAIGGFGSTKGSSTNFMDITPENYFIGHETGMKVGETSLYNSVMGYQAAKNLSTGSYNTVIGYLADSSLTSGSNNIVIGASAGLKLTSGSHNTLIGYGAGLNHTNQQYNVMIGTTAGYNVTGSYNTFMGINAGYKIKAGVNNTFLGTNAGAMLEAGNGNTIIGIDAGRGGGWDPFNYYGYTTSNNTIIGNNAGYNLKNGEGNVFIGFGAGANVSSSSSDKLYIANSSLNPPLIYGDFADKRLGINTMTIDRTFNVGGDAYISGNLQAGSISGPLTGNVTGNVTGDVSGNVTGNVTGNLTGSVNGVETGMIYRVETGEVQNTGKGTFILYWDRDRGEMVIFNNNETLPCFYWYKRIKKEPPGPDEDSGIVNPKSQLTIIPEIGLSGTGIEVHFGFPDPDGGYCSVWVQFIEGSLIGHYQKF